LDLKDKSEPDFEEEILIATNKYHKKNSVIFINLGYGAVPQVKSLKYLVNIKSQNLISTWVLFCNYPTYRQEGNFIYQKSIRVNFLPILPLNKEDTKVSKEIYEKLFGKIDLKCLAKVENLSGGNPGLYKSLWRIFEQKKDQTIESILTQSSLVERLERISDELGWEDVKVILGESNDLRSYARLRLFGYLNSGGKPFTPLLVKYLEKLKESREFELILTPSEKSVLRLLESREGEVVLRDDIAKMIWVDTWTEKYSDWAIDSIISGIRKKLGGTSFGGKIMVKKKEGFYLKK
jgi:hypothetical protein